MRHEEDLWRRTNGGEIIEASVGIATATGRHLGRQDASRRHPRAIQEAAGRQPEDQRSL